MPDDINGNNSLTPGYKAVTGQKVLASQHNPPLEDLSSCMTNRLHRLGLAPMLANLPMGGFRVTGVGDGEASTDAATFGQVQSASPIGAVIDFAGATAPTGWLLCYGQTVSRTDYAALFAVTGTTFGVGDGATTFNVPDLRGRVTAGKDDMGGADAGRLSFFGAVARAIGGVLGTASHVLSLAQLPSASLPVSGTAELAGAHTHDLGSRNGGGAGAGSWPLRSETSARDGTFSVGSAGGHTHPVTGTATLGNDEAHTNAQPTMMLNKIVKAL